MGLFNKQGISIFSQASFHFENSRVQAQIAYDSLHLCRVRPSAIKINIEHRTFRICTNEVTTLRRKRREMEYITDVWPVVSIRVYCELSSHDHPCRLDSTDSDPQQWSGPLASTLEPSQGPEVPSSSIQMRSEFRSALHTLADDNTYQRHSLASPRFECCRTVQFLSSFVHRQP